MFQETFHPNVTEHQRINEKEESVGSSAAYESAYQYVIKYLGVMVETIRNNPKIREYLEDSQFSESELLESLTKIIESFRDAHEKSKQTVVMKHGIGKSWLLLEEFFKSKDVNNLDSKGKTAWFLQIQTKLGCCLQFLHSFKEEQDITNSPKESFAEVWSKIKIEPATDLKKLKKDTKKLKKMLHTVAAAVINEESHDFKLIKVFSFGCSFPRYTIMSDSGKLRSLQYYRKPTVQLAQKFWNLSENGAIRELSKLTFEGIKTNKKIYLPPDGVYNNKTDIFQENPNNITVRILYSKKLKIYSEGQSIGCCVSGPKEVKEIDTVLVHIHGGGFIALSSRSMQIYTRRWANELDVPIFSVDYRKPPEHCFPQAPYDCFSVYQFLLNHVHKYMNIRPTNIYVAGDSSGGNLSLALTGLILKYKQPIPKGVYLIYPATDLRMQFSESKLNSITDVLLWPSTLLLCLNEYLQKDYKKAEDPLASPILMDEQYINGTVGDKRFPLGWPKTIMTVGTKDPLYDDTLLLMQKMVESKVDCECVVYQQLSHGYMNTDMIIEEAEKTVKQSIEHLKRLMASSLSRTEKKQ